MRSRLIAFSKFKAARNNQYKEIKQLIKIHLITLMHELLSKNITTSGFNPNNNQPGKFFPPVKNPVHYSQPITIAPQPVFNECYPSRALTWADYKGAVPVGATWGAMTISGIRVVPVNGKILFQAFFDSAQSWVNPWNNTPGDNSVNG